MIDDEKINPDNHQENENKDSSVDDILSNSYSWQAISKQIDAGEKISKDIVFTGKILQGGNFSGENFANADFSGSNLQEVNLTNSNLKNVNFTGADLSGADLSGAVLDGAVFTGAKLIGTNFTGAKMKNVRLIDADIQDAILLGIDIDDISLADLQELIEYLAAYYPHKLNLSRINLTMLDLKRIDLTNVNLKGVDFTGCDFTGVNIYELDLSECIISPAQIEQAIGHKPTPLELQKILAPKKQKPKRKMKGIDFSEFFHSRGGFDWDTTKGGTDFKTMFKKGKEIIDSFKREDSDKRIMEKFNEKHSQKTNEEPQESNVDDLRKVIEKRKQEFLDQKMKETKEEKQHHQPINQNTRGGGYER